MHLAFNNTLEQLPTRKMITSMTFSIITAYAKSTFSRLTSSSGFCALAEVEMVADLKLSLLSRRPSDLEAGILSTELLERTGSGESFEQPSVFTS